MSEFVMVFNKDSYVETATKNFKAFLDGELYIDLIFVCRNNRKVGAHQIVMGCISKLFYSMFLENVNSVKEKVIHVYVPDIRAKIMKRILDFVYCGKALLSKSELDEFNEDIKLLGMPLDVLTSSNELGKTADKSSKKTADPTNPSEPVPNPRVESTPRPSVSTPVANNCESVTSSSSASIPTLPPDIPLTRPTRNLSSPSMSMKTPPPPGFPMIVETRSENAEYNSKASTLTDIDSSNNGNISQNTKQITPHRPVTRTLSQVHSTGSNISMQQNDSTSSQSQPAENLSDTNSSGARKRRKLNSDDIIILDDDDNDDVITLS